MNPTVVSTFESYVSSVEDQAAAALASARIGRPALVQPDLLDGQAGTTLRETVPLNARRRSGAFFTGSALRAATLAGCTDGAEPVQPTLDPAVGAGDLLIEAARAFPIEQNLTQTLRKWGEVLHGRDVEPTFVRLCRARLVLLAASRAAPMVGGAPPPPLSDVLPGIMVGDGLTLLNGAYSAAHIVMNPPFTYRPAPVSVTWGGGRTSLAAMFLGAAVEGARTGTRLTAILPDVIRTGSRYDRLRALVERRLRVSSIEPYGRFDAWTDVDVFILRGVVASGATDSPAVEWWHRPMGERVVGDKFDVHVGPVVPHRDSESGPSRPYLHARTIPLSGEFDVSSAEQRGFRKRLFSPPFVVVRRTSRPSDGSRGLGTMILGSQDVLVENHLIVLTPKSGSLDACREVKELLDSKSAKQWLDERIRCRHLTVRAVSEMPWWAS